MKKITQIIVALVALFFISSPVFAAPLSVFDDWTMIADDDGYDDNGFVDPGWGGQAFDAEYLFYKLSGTTLSIGLQTGFDIDDGEQEGYYAGDLALSFDGNVELGNSSTYEYAFDFGFANTLPLYGDEDYSGDDAGLYAVTSWNMEGSKKSIHFDDSNPFAMLEGNLLIGDGLGAFGKINDSYYRMVSFDLAKIDGLTFSGLDVHWTMSCGNDAIDGSAPVPEPATMVLLGSGLVGLAFYRRRMKK